MLKKSSSIYSSSRGLEDIWEGVDLFEKLEYVLKDWPFNLISIYYFGNGTHLNK